MPKIVYNGIDFDSEEERLFFLFCEELKVNEFIKDYNYHPKEFVLSEAITYDWKKEKKEKNITMVSTLLQPHVYSPDFWIEWNWKKSYGIFYYDIHDGKNKLDKIPFINNIYSDGTDAGSYVEVKPSFDMNNMQRIFSVNQKWVYQEHRMYVQKIIPIGKPNCLFSKTFVPREAMFTAKTKKPKKYKFETKSLNEYVKEIENAKK